MITKSVESFKGAVKMEWTPPRAGLFLRAIVNFSAAPATSENLTITHKSSNGDDYDDVVYSVDPSTGSFDTGAVGAERGDSPRARVTKYCLSIPTLIPEISM